MGDNASDAATARYIDCEALHGVSLSIQICSSQIGQSRVHFVLMPNTLEEDHGYRRQSQIENIANRIRSVLQNNAPPMGGMDFGKLLQDQQLRSLTGGMDVRKVMKEWPGLFQGLRVFQDGNRGCGSKAGMTSSDDDHRNFTWYIEIVRETHASLHNRSKNEDLVEKSTCPGNSRLAADEVGTYSLTRPRLATAMAKMLWRACKYGYLGKIDYKGSPASDTTLRDFSDEMVCIDITASVGGNTIAFAKAFSSSALTLCGELYKSRIKSERVTRSAVASEAHDSSSLHSSTSISQTSATLCPPAAASFSSALAAAVSCCSICTWVIISRAFGTMCLILRRGTEEVRPEEFSILRFFFLSFPMIAPRVVCLLAPVPEVNSTRRPSLSASSLLSLLAAHSLDVVGIDIGIDGGEME
eukprot:scaffold1878_cov149-Chaetoceros_neogracile.AAC.4